MPLGFLAVASHPSSSLSLEEFHAWYEEEHIPLRLNNLPSFLSGARYQAIDSVQGAPEWLAMYEIDDTATFNKNIYTNLRSQRSEREKGVMQRLDALTRITGEDLGVYGRKEDENNTGMKLGSPSQSVVTHSLLFKGAQEHADEIAKEWAAKIAAEVLDNVAGWVRLRVVKVLESGKTTTETVTELVPDESAAYFVIHELNGVDETSINSLQTVAFDGNTNRFAHWRSWKLYKAYPCISQGNVGVAQ